jgi:hypothetical protein
MTTECLEVDVVDESVSRKSRKRAQGPRQQRKGRKRHNASDSKRNGSRNSSREAPKRL